MRPASVVAALRVAFAAAAAVGAAAGGCAMGAGAAADCNALLALDRRCDLRIGGVDPETCSHVYAFLSADCQEALHSYLACTKDVACRLLADGNACLQQGQSMDVACSNGNATITTGYDGNTVTVPRGELNREHDGAPRRPSQP